MGIAYYLTTSNTTLHRYGGHVAFTMADGWSPTVLEVGSATRAIRGGPL